MRTLLISNFLRSKGLIAGLIILLLSGLLSLNIGKQFLGKNQEIVAKTADYQRQSIEGYAHHVTDAIGSTLYYIKFGLINDLPNLAGLSIGNRDINPAVQSVTIRNMEEQKYNRELINPLYQLLGNFDFSFVLIFLFPLIIIALGFNLLSEEKEEGTWNLVLSQTASPVKVLGLKLLIRYVSVLLVLFLLLILAFFYLHLEANGAFFAFALISFLYVTFWFSLVWLVTSFQRNSNQNALVLLIVWVLMTVVIPAGVNALSIKLYPVPEAFATVLKSREGYHDKWDKPIEPTLQKFFAHYPQYKGYSHPEGESFSWLWYYAMQQMGDDEAAAESKSISEKLSKRNAFGKAVALFVPSMNTQLSLNALALSDMDNYLNFMKALEEFHEKKRLSFYDKIFSNSPVEEEPWSSYNLETYKDSLQINGRKAGLPLVLAVLLCIGLASARFTKL